VPGTSMMMMMMRRRVRVWDVVAAAAESGDALA
jgi:hypothetical protein